MLMWFVISLTFLSCLVLAQGPSNSVMNGRWTQDELGTLRGTTLFCMAQCIGLTTTNNQKPCKSNTEEWTKFVAKADGQSGDSGGSAPADGPPPEDAPPPPDDFPPPPDAKK
ncbi:hypothetical protein B566_EDAN013318 [Ephemera danica]|nr:hypothetical protein B566_EDAN013318 [Ephemera danica]